ncbi:MAG: penicillin-binding protein 1C [Chloroflexi bacterium RBG_16_54_18]|nr:MAG: penicillin-binding protein 1C [Chloroflexi bacterium RBG_16_54_18]
MKQHTLIRWFFLLVSLAAISGAGFVFWLTWDLPDINQLNANLRFPSVRIVDRNGALLYEILEEDEGRNVVVPLERIPEHLIKATIATEDQGFFSHPGVDLKGIMRAMWINLRGGEMVVGGSTITQQVSRNLLLASEERGERSLRRKLREMILAFQVTQRLSKDEVLELYLNQTYFGGMAFGVEAAAQTFFAKPVSELDLAESAMLAGMPQAPAVYNPFTDISAAKGRQEVVLRLMEESGTISQEQHASALRENLVLAEKPYPMEAPHFVMMVKNELDGLFTREEIYANGGLVVWTTLDLNWQKIAEQAIKHHLDAMQHSEDGFGHNINNAALVAIDPLSGEVLSLVGSPDYFDEQHGGAINMAISSRQPGSALKPLVYSAALDPRRRTGPWTAATMLLDVKTSFLTQEGKSYIPENYDLQEHGPVLLREALASSLNIPAVIALDHIGLDELFSELAGMGITTLKDPHTYDLSLALGGGEIRLLELTAAYGAFANTGYRVEPLLIREITNPSGDILFSPKAGTAIRVMDPRVTWLINDILSDNDARRIGFGLNSVLRLDRPAAVKTGTTSNFHDNWTVGYTPDLVVGVWSGNTNYESMRGVNGLSGAAPIWHQFMRSVLKGFPPKPFIQPPGFVRSEVCALSGLLPTQFCPFTKLEWFIQGTEPASYDQFYKEIEVDQTTGKIAGDQTPPNQKIRKVVLDLPPQALAWAKSQKLVLLDEFGGVSQSDGGRTGQTIPIQMISPSNGSIYLLSDGVPANNQRIKLEAFADEDVISVTIYMDGEELAVLDSEPFQIWWVLSSGEHQVWVEAITRSDQIIKSPVTHFSVK